MCFRTSRCCCCNDVERGSRIIAIVGIVFAAIGVVLNLIALDIPRIIGGIISVAISYMLLHGVNNRKTGFMMVWMVIQMIGIVLTGIAIAAVIVLFGFFAANNPQVEDALNDYTHTREHGAMLAVIGIVAAVLALIFLVNLHFFSVVYSHYKNVQEELYGNGGQIITPGVMVSKDGPPPYGKA